MRRYALVVAGAVGLAGLACIGIATAEDAARTTTQPSPAAVQNVSFSDPQPGIASILHTSDAQFSLAEISSDRPFGYAEAPAALAGMPDRRRIEVSLAANTADGLGVGVARRTTFDVSAQGDIRETGGGAEVRIGQRLASLAERRDMPTWDQPSWYFFIADDDEAITWTPGGGSSGHAWAYQEDRVEIGDNQIGVAMEAMGVQASFAYVQRDIQGKLGSAEENFTGFTLTWKR